MSKLIDFLALPDVQDIVSEEYINDRIGTVKIKAMSEKDHSKYQRTAIGKVNAKMAKSGQVSFDNGAYNLICVANHMIEPNFLDSKFLDSIGAVLPEEAINRKLLAGEIDEIATRIKTLSGFDSDINDDIDEAKN